MSRSKLLLTTVGAVGLALAGLPAQAGDFSFGFGFSTGSWRYVDCRPTYTYYEPAPVYYSDYAYEPVVVVRSTPRVVYRESCPPPVVYRDRSPRVYYRDHSPRVAYRDRSPRVHYRDRSPRPVVVRDCAPRPRPHYTGSYHRGGGPSRYFTASPRSHTPTRHVAPRPPRHSIRAGARW